MNEHVGLVRKQIHPVMVSISEVFNMLQDTCPWLRHLISIIQLIILPINVGLYVIYINIVCLQCVLAPPSGEISKDRYHVRFFALRNCLEMNSRISFNFGIE